MVSAKDKVQKALSEVRTLVLGAQILLGFQYQALFLPRFEDLPGYGRPSRQGCSGSLLLLALTMILLMTPAPYHRLAEDGENTTHFELGWHDVRARRPRAPRTRARRRLLRCARKSASERAARALRRACERRLRARPLVRCTVPGASPNE
jgi:hypothetical protein